MTYEAAILTPILSTLLNPIVTCSTTGLPRGVISLSVFGVSFSKTGLIPRIRLSLLSYILSLVLKRSVGKLGCVM
jgi:hypothetical protein